MTGRTARDLPRILGTIVAITAVLTAAAIWGARPAAACSCAAPPEPETALREADAVFTGEVTQVTEGAGQLGPGYVAQLEVDTVFDGDVGASVEVHTPTDSAACGYDFRSGRAELVYAVLDDAGRLNTNLCDRTAPVADAEEDLAVLGEGDDPSPVPAGPAETDGDRTAAIVVAVLLLVAVSAAVVTLRTRRAR